MKTAVSVPDETFALGDRWAHDLGISRSEFFTRAVRLYLDELQAESTRAVDAALGESPSIDSSNIATAAAGLRTLDASDDEW